jgi:hypothetical protein
MNIDDVKLQPEDLRGIKVVFKHVYEAPIEDIAKAAQLKLLDVLSQKDMIWHYQGIRNSKPFCYDDCKLCEIEKLLKGGE